MKKKLREIAESAGCSICEGDNGALHLDAPSGMVFRSCDSASIVLWSGACVGRQECPDMGRAIAFALSEIAEGFNEA